VEVIDINKLNLIKKELKVYRTFGEKYKRFGSENDGGYVMVDDISNEDFVISCGIGDDVTWSSENIEFEREILDVCKEIHMYECAIDGVANLPKNTKFFRGYVGEEILLEDMFKKSEKQKDYILKIDIEGAEWDFFDKAKSNHIKKFRQMSVEFHDIPDMIKNDFKKIYSVLGKINKTHRLMFINTNNWGEVEVIDKKLIPSVIEVLFLRKNDYNFIDFDLPESLLSPCCKERDDLELFFR